MDIREFYRRREHQRKLRLKEAVKQHRRIEREQRKQRQTRFRQFRKRKQ